tara:strand:+ start:254 stop:616 length:363 start_codon:yes stop_codon:yes gene_type:complete
MTTAMRNSQAQHTDFGFLQGVIDSNPKFMPSNVDMMLERKGKFFIGEWKREGEQISMGQKILLKALASKPDFVVYVIEGHSDDTGTEVKAIRRLNGDILSASGYGEDALKTLIQMWYNSL